MENNGSLYGGVGILVKNTTPHQQLHINTGLQDIAVRATCHKTITICSIYLSPSTACNITDLENLISQLPPPVLLLGDFNAHSQQWGSTTRGKMVDDFFLKSNLSLLNSGPPTYLHPATASFSAIDLSIAHPALYLDFCWQTDSDLHSSDHYPTVITTETPSPSFAKPTWMHHKADWAAFSHQAALELCTDALCGAEDPIQQFTDVVINIANNIIPKSKPNTKNIIPSGATKTAKQPLKPGTRPLNGWKSTRHNTILKTTDSSGPKPGVWLKLLNATPGKHTSPKSTVVPL